MSVSRLRFSQVMLSQDYPAWRLETIRFPRSPSQVRHEPVRFRPRLAHDLQKGVKGGRPGRVTARMKIESTWPRLVKTLAGVMAAAVVFVGIPMMTVSATGDDYPFKGRPNVVDPWGFYTGYCTSFTAWRLSQAVVEEYNWSHYLAYDSRVTQAPRYIHFRPAPGGGTPPPPAPPAPSRPAAAVIVGHPYRTTHTLRVRAAASVQSRSIGLLPAGSRIIVVCQDRSASPV